MRPAVQNGPCDAARVLALQEKGLGLSVLEAEDLAVATDIELTLQEKGTGPQVSLINSLHVVYNVLFQRHCPHAN